MKLLILLLLPIIYLASCSTNNKKYNYIRVISIIKADSITDYNKGFVLGDYFYYDPQRDSVAFRILQSWDPYMFGIYRGKLNNKGYADTIAMLIPLLKTLNAKHIDTAKHCFQPNCYCTPDYYVEYNDSKGSEFFWMPEFNEDRSRSFLEFFYQLKETPLGEKMTPENESSNSEVVVNILKGFGTYDRVVKRYAPLPCEKGLYLKKLNGTWRTIGDENNDATLLYTINKIDTAGNWIMDRFDHGKTTRLYTGKIKSIGSGNIIKVESEHGIATLEILNLTESCFEYKVKSAKSGGLWRLNRMK